MRRTVKLKVTRVGNSSGVVLPKEALTKLKVEQGDTVYLTEASDGFRITPYDPDFERTMEIADEVMDKYRDTLAALAK